jgi:glutathione S-transferase
MYTLHYAPDNASLIVRLVLEGAGLPYRTALVDRRIRQQDSPAYRALNPTGLIPTLETPQGVITETGAILLWLADRHDLAQGADRATLLRWLFFTANTPHADLRQMFYPDQYVPEGAISAHHAILSARMIRHYGLLNAAAQANPDLFAPQGILAPYIACLMRWSVLYPQGQTPWFRMDDFPALHSMATGLEALPQTHRVALAEGLGPTPFTNPRLATPPTGSAT